MRWWQAEIKDPAQFYIFSSVLGNQFPNIAVYAVLTVPTFGHSQTRDSLAQWSARRAPLNL